MELLESIELSKIILYYKIVRGIGVVIIVLLLLSILSIFVGGCD